MHYLFHSESKNKQSIPLVSMMFVSKKFGKFLESKLAMTYRFGVLTPYPRDVRVVYGQAINDSVETVCFEVKNHNAIGICMDITTLSRNVFKVLHVILYQR